MEGSKIADLCAATTDVICVAVSSSELQYGTSSYAMPLIQAVLREKAQTASPVQLFVFVFGAVEGEEDADVQRATELVRQAWDELDKKEVAFEDVVQAHVHALSKRNAVRMAAARSGLTDALRATTRASFQSVAEAIPSVWSVIARSPTKRVMNSMQRTALLRVDRAYEAAVEQLERLSRGWVQRVEDKKVVGGFGERADALAKRVLATFDEATVGVSFQGHRAQRRRELAQRITELYRTLFEQQATTLLADATQQLRKELLRVARSNPPSSEPSEEGEGEDEDRAETMDGVQVTEVAPPEQAIEEFMSKNGLPPESRPFVAEFFNLLDTIPSTKNLPVNELQTFEALLQVDYWLFNQLKDLEVPSLQVLCADTMKTAQRSLRDYVDKFPSSPAAQAAALQDTEEQLEKPPHARSLSIRPRLDFVVSVDLPGSGNLQGYATYAFDFGTVCTLSVWCAHDWSDEPSRLGLCVARFGLRSATSETRIRICCSPRHRCFASNPSCISMSSENRALRQFVSLRLFLFVLFLSRVPSKFFETCQEFPKATHICTTEQRNHVDKQSLNYPVGRAKIGSALEACPGRRRLEGRATADPPSLPSTAMSTRRSCAAGPAERLEPWRSRRSCTFGSP